MPDVTQMLGPRGGVAPGQRNLVLGRVSKSKAAPTSGDDLLYVVLPDFSTDHSEPARWTPIPGWSLPAQDAEVLVGFDDTREPYALWWSGQPAPVTVTGSRGGNAALASLLTELAAAGLIVNSTTA